MQFRDEFRYCNLNPIFNESCRNEPKITLKEEIQMRAAFDLDVFTNLYVENIKNVGSTRPGNERRQVTPSVGFIVEFGVRALARSLELNTAHSTLLRRHLMLNLYGVYSKLEQDARNLEAECTQDACKSDKEANLNDRIYALSMIEYLKKFRFEADPIRPAELMTNHDDFYKKNIDKIEKLVQIYY
jgi:hypothetical protein